MSDLEVADDPADSTVAGTTWHRLSPRMLLVHPVVEVTRLLPLIAGVVLAGGGNGGHLIPGLVATGLVTGLAIARWFTTQVRITPEQVELKDGVLRRRSIATRRDRIRTVDVTSHLLHRALGLSRVVIGTGTSDRKGRDKFVLDGLTADAARHLRDELLHDRRTSVPESPVDVGQSPVTTLAQLDRRWVRFAPFTLSGVVTGLVIWGFLWRLQGDGVDILHSGPLRAATRSAERMPTATVVIVVAVLLVAFVTVTSMAGYVLAFWNFRLVRHPNGTVETTRGLLTTRSTSLERRRLVGVRVSEPLPLRWVGGARLLAIATGLRVGRGAERGGEVLLPPAPAGDVRRVGSAVLDGSPALDADLVPHGRQARRRRFVRALTGALLLLALAVVGRATGGSTWPVVAAVVLVVAAPVLARDRYASLGHRVSDCYLVARTGSLVRRRTLLHADAVIGWTIRRSVFQRRAGLATLIATTAAGRQADVVPDIPLPEALAVADELTPGLLTQFQAPYPAVWSQG